MTYNMLMSEMASQHGIEQNLRQAAYRLVLIGSLLGVPTAVFLGSVERASAITTDSFENNNPELRGCPVPGTIVRTVHRTRPVLYPTYQDGAQGDWKKIVPKGTEALVLNPSPTSDGENCLSGRVRVSIRNPRTGKNEIGWVKSVDLKVVK